MDQLDLNPVEKGQPTSQGERTGEELKQLREELRQAARESAHKFMVLRSRKSELLAAVERSGAPRSEERGAARAQAQIEIEKLEQGNNEAAAGEETIRKRIAELEAKPESN